VAENYFQHYYIFSRSGPPLYSCIISNVLTTFLTFTQPSFDISGYPFNGIQKIRSVSSKAITTPLSAQSIRFDADNSINDSMYRIGSGDEFIVALTKNPSVYYPGTVNQNGDLFIPEIGIIPVLKMRLCDAKKRIKEGCEQILKKEVYVSLEKVKMATVNITGPLANPGTYSQSAMMRIADVIKLANLDSLPAFQKVNYRKVRCENGDSVMYCDLYRYLLRGDLSQNPYIFPGDRISIVPISSEVFLGGEVNNQGGRLPILPSEDVCSFLDLFEMNSAADSENVIIQRTDKNGLNRTVVNVNYKNREPFALVDNDMVIVPKKKNYAEQLLVSVTGAIARPGSYPVIKKGVSALSIIELAGGPTEFADMNRAVVVRESKRLPSDNSTNLVKEIRPEINSSLSMLKYSRDYSILRLRDGDVELEGSDRIILPKKDTRVYISGSVSNPGGVAYKQGELIDYYVKAAGGYQHRADRRNCYVITTYEDIVVAKDKNGAIEPGDIVVVPVSQENKTLTTIILPLFSVFSATVALMLSVYTTYQSTKK
jgi:protein involved in polysaccharide export with SLBB domain